jgi:hypothetical protein
MYELTKGKSRDIWTAVFAPFSPQLWAAIAGVVLFHGLAISFLTNKKHRKKSRKTVLMSPMQRILNVHIAEVLPPPRPCAVQPPPTFTGPLLFAFRRHISAGA